MNITTLKATINGPTEAEIKESALKVGQAFFGEDKNLLVTIDATAVQTPDGQIRSFVADCIITDDVQF